MKTKTVIIVLLTTIIVGGGVYLYMSNQNLRQENAVLSEKAGSIEELGVRLDPTNGEIIKLESEEDDDASKDETPNYQVYDNPEIGIYFEYPINFEITRDEVAMDYPDLETDWYVIELENDEGTKIKMERYADGYGPFFPNRTIETSLNSGQVYVDKIIENDMEEMDPKGLLIMTGVNVDPGGFDYISIFYWADDQSESHNDVLTEILQSMRVY